MSASITTRAVTLEDVAVLRRLADEAIEERRHQRGGEQWVAIDLADRDVDAELRSAASDGRAMVGEIKQVPVAMAVWEHRPSGVAELTALFTRPEVRGVGLGSALLHAVRSAAAHDGCGSWQSDAMPGDRATKNFFEAHGLRARRLVVWSQLDAET